MKKLLLCLLTAGAIWQTQAQCWKQIDVGSKSIFGIKEDGTLWAWGRNVDGQLGDGTFIDRSMPVQIGVDNDWKNISAGNGHVDSSYDHNLGIKNNGTLWAWGDNEYGQLGDGTTTDKNIPVQVGNDNDWDAIATGNNRSLAIKTNGTLWGWGWVTTQVTSNIPVQIGIDSDWSSISAFVFDSHCAAIKNDGTLWVWGRNEYGQLGQGFSSAPLDQPTQVGTHTWKSVVVGVFYTVAIKDDGTLWSWGYNVHGTLADGTNTDNFIPTQIGTDTWQSITAGSHFMEAIKSDGTLWAWGLNHYGQLGDGTDINRNSLTLVSADTDWKSVSCGVVFDIATKTDNTTYVWGMNDANWLGAGVGLLKVLSPVQMDYCEDPTASLNENTLSQITLYPNPTASALTLANAENLTVESLTVTDMTGKLVLSQKGNNPEINVEVLPAGIYFLNVSAQQGVQHLKFVKE